MVRSGISDRQVGVPANKLNGIPASSKEKKKSRKKEGYVSPGRARYLASRQPPEPGVIVSSTKDSIESVKMLSQQQQHVAVDSI
jgi:hypothetical protein